jgi:hypothetical protein
MFEAVLDEASLTLTTFNVPAAAGTVPALATAGSNDHVINP